MSLREADALLRKDLKELCTMFQRYGKDSLLLAALAYNVGPYRILGNRTKYPKSILLKKIETGNRDFKDDYVQFCHWKGKKIPSIERRRYSELILLYIP
jgi:lysozyme